MVFPLLDGRFLGSPLPYYAMCEVRDPGRADRPRVFNFDVSWVDALEQPDPVAEQPGGEMRPYLVEEPGFEELPAAALARSSALSIPSVTRR
jgi:hypothetical protein